MAEEIVTAPESKLVGQKPVWNRLKRAVENDRIASAYLFHGPSGVGKEGFALRFASLLNCRAPRGEPCGLCPSCIKFGKLHHPNLTLVLPLPKDRDISKDDPPIKALSDKTLSLLEDLTQQKASDPYRKIDLPRANTILLNTIREIRGKAYLKAMEAGRKMILVFDAHKLMTQQAESANALLKILEEPPENTTFVLTTDYPDRLSETIRSRCQTIYFPPVPEDEITRFLIKSVKKKEPEAHLMAHLSQGNIRTALSLSAGNLEEVDTLVTSLINWITSNSESGWRSFLHHGMSVYRTNAGEFAFHLQLLSYWFRDAMHTQKGDGEAELILRTCGEAIRDFAERYPKANYPEIVSAVETCTHSLSRNYNISLVLTNLLLDIQENLQPGVVE